MIVIAGNKIDLEKNRRVTEADAVAYAQSVGALHFHTSAKANKGLDDVFNVMGSKMVEQKLKNKSSSKGGHGGKKLVIVDSEPEPVAKKGCC